MGSSAVVVAAGTCSKSVITEIAGSSSVTRGIGGSHTREPAARWTRGRAEYSRVMVSPFRSGSAGELRAAAEMAISFLGLADSLHQRGERHVAVVGRLEGEARLDVTLRFSPELLAHAELSKRQKERRIARMKAQPLLGALDLRQRAAPGRLAVDGHEAF